MLAVAASAWAAAGKVAGSVGGLPAHGLHEGVEAVNAQGVIGAVGNLSARGSYDLSLAPGAWIVVASAVSGHDQTLAAFDPPVLVRSGHTAHAHHARVKVQANVAAAQRLPPGSVVSVDPILIEDQRTCDGQLSCANLDYTATAINDLFRACGARGITFVDTSASFLKFAQQESGLSRSGRLAVPFTYRPLAPKYEVAPASGNELGQAAGVVDTSEVTVLMSVNFAGSQQSVSRSFVGPDLIANFSHEPSDEDVEATVHREDAALAAKMCGA